MLYIANLFNLLNLHYNTHEELYIHNQSLVNYALGNIDETEAPDEDGGIESSFEVKSYGLLTLLTANSILKNDTVISMHFAGQFAPDDTCLYMPNPYKSLSIAGNVTLAGHKKLPSEYISEFYLDNNPNKLTVSGPISVSGDRLPFLNPAFKQFYKREIHPAVNLSSIEKLNDSVYFNSFLSETKEIELINHKLDDIAICGNFIIRSPDSIRVGKTAQLRDVILCAPVITFEDGFKGSLQVFATEKVTVGSEVYLNYPSLLCLYNDSLDKSSIIIKKKSRVEGAIALFGFPTRAMESNMLEIAEDGCIVGDVYCEGLLSLSGNVYGSVYSNKLMHKTETGKYENSIFNIEINANKRPAYFVAFPLFQENNMNYGIIKKVL